MDLVFDEKDFAQKVNVVNELRAKVETSETDPLKVSFPSSFVSSSGNQNRLNVQVENYDKNVIVRPSENHVNGHIGCVHVVNSGIGYIFPMNYSFYNDTLVGFESSIVPELHSNFEEAFPDATSITVFYSYQNSAGLVTFGYYQGES